MVYKFFEKKSRGNSIITGTGITSEHRQVKVDDHVRILKWQF